MRNAAGEADHHIACHGFDKTVNRANLQGAILFQNA